MYVFIYWRCLSLSVCVRPVYIPLFFAGRSMLPSGDATSYSLTLFFFVLHMRLLVVFLSASRALRLKLFHIISTLVAVPLHVLISWNSPLSLSLRVRAVNISPLFAGRGLLPNGDQDGPAPLQRVVRPRIDLPPTGEVRHGRVSLPKSPSHQPAVQVQYSNRHRITPPLPARPIFKSSIIRSKRSIGPDKGVVGKVGKKGLMLVESLTVRKRVVWCWRIILVAA